MDIIAELARNHMCLIIDGNRLPALEDGIVWHISVGTQLSA